MYVWYTGRCGIFGLSFAYGLNKNKPYINKWLYITTWQEPATVNLQMLICSSLQSPWLGDDIRILWDQRLRCCVVWGKHSESVCQTRKTMSRCTDIRVLHSINAISLASLNFNCSRVCHESKHLSGIKRPITCQLLSVLKWRSKDLGYIFIYPPTALVSIIDDTHGWNVNSTRANNSV